MDWRDRRLWCWRMTDLVNHSYCNEACSLVSLSGADEGVTIIYKFSTFMLSIGVIETDNNE